MRACCELEVALEQEKALRVAGEMEVGRKEVLVEAAERAAEKASEDCL